MRNNGTMSSATRRSRRPLNKLPEVESLCSCALQRHLFKRRFSVTCRLQIGSFDQENQY